MKTYRNIETGAIWTLEEVKEAVEQFKGEGAMSLEETLEGMEEINAEFWLIEYAGADRFEALLKADSMDEAIEQGRSEYNALTDHDKDRRDAVEVWMAPRYTDEDTPDTLVIPDEDNVIETHTIK